MRSIRCRQSRCAHHVPITVRIYISHTTLNVQDYLAPSATSYRYDPMSHCCIFEDITFMMDTFCAHAETEDNADGACIFADITSNMQHVLLLCPACPSCLAISCIQMVFTSNNNLQTSSTRRCSQTVTHPSTNRALCQLTSEFRWDRVYTSQYGRWRNSGFECFPARIHAGHAMLNMVTVILV